MDLEEASGMEKKRKQKIDNFAFTVLNHPHVILHLAVVITRMTFRTYTDCSSH